MGLKGDKPALVISTLEALAVLLALKVFFGQTGRELDTKVQIMPNMDRQQG